MLYDNALLSFVYSEAFQVTGKAMYRDVVVETLNYVLEKMQDSEGGFYSAEDAGDVGKEGEFYVWQWSEDLEKLQDLYSVSKNGNFEGANILNIADPTHWEKKKDFREIHKKLYEEREK